MNNESNKGKRLIVSKSKTQASRAISALLDRAFWRFLSGFVFILLISFSLLTILGVWRESKENYSALIRAFQK